MIFPDDGSLTFMELDISAPPGLSPQTVKYFGGTKLGACIHKSDQTMCVVLQTQTISWTVNDRNDIYGPSGTEPEWPELSSPPSPTSTHELAVTDWEGTKWGTLFETISTHRKVGFWEFDAGLGEDAWQIANIQTFRKSRWRWRWFGTSPYASCWNWFRARTQLAVAEWLDTESGTPTPTLFGDATDTTAWENSTNWDTRDVEDWEEWGGTEWEVFNPFPAPPPDPDPDGAPTLTSEMYALALLYPCKQSGGFWRGSYPGFVPGAKLPWLIYDYPRGLNLPIGGGA